MCSIAKPTPCTRAESPALGGNHNPKTKGNRLARRARSFKDDFLGILSQMRSPGGSTRSASPSSPKLPPPEGSDSGDLECNLRQAKLALKHFRDVVAKNKLEMLPGNGTIVLETVAAIYILLKKHVLNEQSSTILSATNQLYQSLAQLIRICDEYLLVGDKALGQENIPEIVQKVEDAIQNLVSLSKDKLAAREACLKKLSLDAGNHYPLQKPRLLSEKTALETAQRNSLPDIPLTPREREILEQTSAFVLERHSQSSENILRDSPPPKPPHPDREQCPPPLPPKKRRQQNQLEITGVKTSLENLSLRSKSPDTSSVFSASLGSLDSNLREDDMRNLLDDSIVAGCYNGNSHSCCYWDSSSNTSTEMRTQDSSMLCVKTERLSGSQAESGIGSMPSRRSSSQSYSACSQQVSSTRSSQVSQLSHESHLTPEKRSTDSTIHLHSSSRSTSSSSTDQTLSVNGSLWEKTSYTNHHATCVSATIVDQTVFSDSPRHKCDIISLCDLHKNAESYDFLNPLNEGWTLFSSPSLDQDTPPALPKKTRGRSDRQPSQYDNVDGIVQDESMTTTCHFDQSSVVVSNSSDSKLTNEIVAKEMSNIQNFSSEESKTIMVHSKTIGELGRSDLDNLSTLSEGMPPPLPIKKKHMFQSVAYSVMAYMEMFGNASHGNTSEFMRHSLHIYHQRQNNESSHHSSRSMSVYTRGHHSLDPRSLKYGLPPVLPPKRNRLSGGHKLSDSSTPSGTPTHSIDSDFPHAIHVDELIVAVNNNGEDVHSSLTPEPADPLDPLETLENLSPDTCILDQLSVSQYLVLKKLEEEGPEVRGGHPDALLVHATKAHKNDFLYQEAFLTTYRTFMSPLDLIQKLCYRHEKFSGSQEGPKQRAAREAFALLVRIASDLTLADLDTTLLQTLIKFIQQLLCRGDLHLARALRAIMLAKCEAKRLRAIANCAPLPHNVTTRQYTLLDFKSEHVAEQMTLLDAALFLKIEIPEVLIWAQEQNEERSPNLTRFTEHFNKMSYWARSRILEQPDAKERERYVVKFIKIMKHLRKMNNFNSYLALLSALDSAPIRRLEWQKQITEGLKEYCALIDSSSSFRAYRQALSETQPPCIPYIGLVLQDLTFVHIGNSDILADGTVNFSKRWQQFNIVENMKRFKIGLYNFKKNERIISFFNDFDESLSEEAMWQISEKIKPRGSGVGKKL